MGGSGREGYRVGDFIPSSVTSKLLIASLPSGGGEVTMLSQLLTDDQKPGPRAVLQPDSTGDSQQRDNADLKAPKRVLANPESQHPVPVSPDAL